MTRRQLKRHDFDKSIENELIFNFKVNTESKMKYN